MHKQACLPTLLQLWLPADSSNLEVLYFMLIGCSSIVEVAAVSDGGDASRMHMRATEFVN